MTRLAFPNPADAYPAVGDEPVTLRYFADPDGRVPIEADADGMFRLPEGQTRYWVQVDSGGGSGLHMPDMPVAP